MRTIQTATPRHELKAFVRCYAQREIECDGTGFEQPNIASLEHILSFDFRDQTLMEFSDGQSILLPRINVVGSQTLPSGCARFSGRFFAFGIFLKPLASWQLFRIPPGDLANRNIDGADILGKGMQFLWLALAESKAFAERVRVAEDYLLPFALNALVRTSIMKSAQHMLRHKGAISIEGLANHTALSVRQYERRFADEMGLSPKLFARITRFQMALDAKRISPARTWLGVAHEFGYFDQMHMIRDFKNLGGGAPSQLSEQIGDLRPWSLANRMTLCDLSEPPQRARHRK
jgi:AraC-like DNA-binding protein